MSWFRDSRAAGPRTRRCTGGRHRDRGRERTGSVALRPVPENLGTGSAGVEVPMTLVREGSVSRVRVPSADRQDLLKKPSLH